MKIIVALVLLAFSLGVSACGQRVYPAKPADAVQDTYAY
jgi:hypothetical protein